MVPRSEIRDLLSPIGRVTFHRNGKFTVERRSLSEPARGLRAEIASLIPDVRVLRVVEFPSTWRELRVSRAVCLLGDGFPRPHVGGPRVVARVTSSKGAI